MAYKIKFPAKIKKRIENGKIIEQKAWSFIKELNSFSDERLDSAAVIDGYREYTYRQMFRKWEHYAEVFSALGMTEENGTRVGLLPDFSAETLFSFYALNMTGASVSLVHFLDFIDTEHWDVMIEKEGITDLIISDTKIVPEILDRIIRSKERLGLRNIIILHKPGNNRFMSYDMRAKNRMRYLQLRQIKGAVFMRDLLQKHEAYPITYSSGKSREDAVILHTSGTTNGIHKPIPLSDRGVNESVVRLLRSESFTAFKKPVRTILAMDITSAFGCLDMMHLPFAYGGAVLIVPEGMRNPAASSLFTQYGVNIMFSVPFAFEHYLKIPYKIDLSSIELFFFGGAHTSVDLKKRVNAFLKKNGSKARVTIGYGLTEAAGACIISTPDKDDDSMGFPLPGVKVRIFDETEEKYYKLSDGPRTGVLFISSPSVSCGTFNGIEFFRLEEIDGDRYLNTYDLVRVNEDGSLNCVGRMNKFFVNNEGVKFDAGLVEAAVAAEKGILGCGLAPVYDKLIHDTIPVLYVQTSSDGPQRLMTVRNALVNVFIKKKNLRNTNLPMKCVITDEIPVNTAGKVDVYTLTENGARGECFIIKPVKRKGEVVDIKLKPTVEGMSSFSNLPEELRGEAKLINHFRGVFNDFGMFGNFGEDIHPSGISDGAGRNYKMPPFADQFMQRQGMSVADAAFSVLSDIHYLAMLHNQRMSEFYYGEMNPPEYYPGKDYDPAMFWNNILNMFFNPSQTDHYYED